MINFSNYLTEVFEFSNDEMKLPNETNLIHYFKNGFERFTDPEGNPRDLPYKEMVFHSPVQDAPRTKNNLWVHVLHYPMGYPVQGLHRVPHLQIHFDVSHVTDHAYLDELRDSKLRSKRKSDQDPGVLYMKAFAPQGETDVNKYAGGNAFQGVGKAKPDTGMSFLFRKIAPTIVKTAWHASKLYPKLPIAFSAGSDVPGAAERKFAMYSKIIDSLKTSNLIHPETKLIDNPVAFEGQLPIFHVVRPIH